MTGTYCQEITGPAAEKTTVEYLLLWTAAMAAASAAFIIGQGYFG